MIIQYHSHTPSIGKNVFIAGNATVIGNCHIQDLSSIWYGTVLRGDMERIRVGESTNIQDNCTVHTDKGFPTVIGNRVSIGHNAVIHGCTIEDDCLIGIGASVLSGAHVMKGAVIAAGSVIKEGQVIGPRCLAAGAPAAIKKKLSLEEVKRFQGPANNYLRLAKKHKSVFKTSFQDK